mgnify:FL=1|jgi:uncharacterized protein
MSSFARVFAIVVVLAMIGGAVGGWFGLRYLEHRWTFIPDKYDPGAPWEIPAGVAEVSFPTSDGVRLHGWFRPGQAPRNGVTVLLMLGRTGKLPTFKYEIDAMQRRGFDLLLYNYRGYGKSEGTTLSEATLVLDGRAALRYLTEERGIAPGSIALVGISLGAAVAVDLATSSPCRAVVLIGAFASLKQAAKYARPWIPDFLLDHLESPFDTVGKVAGVNCPVLLVHGESDKIFPLFQAEEIYQAAPLPKRLIVVPDAGHWRPTRSDNKYFDQVASFIISGK